MNVLEKAIAKLRAQAELAQKFGLDTKLVEQELKDIEQAMAGSEAGLTDSQVAAILGPVAAKLNPNGPFPSDASKNTGVYDMTRWAQEQAANANANAGKTQLNQDEANKPKTEALDQEVQDAREAALSLLLQDVEDENIKKVLRANLSSAKTAEEVMQAFPPVAEQMKKVFGFSVGSKTLQVPTGVGLLDKEKKYEQAPKNAEEAINKLVQEYEEAMPEEVKQAGKQDDLPKQLRQLMQNIYNHTDYGRQAMRYHLLEEQGRLDQAGENVKADLVVSRSFFFPIIRRVFSKLFLPVIASIQTIDRPEGKIFYMEALNEEGANLADNHYYDYSNNNTEFADAKKVKFVLSDQSVTTTTKKLKAVSSYEKIQDARAYHDLDAMEIALGMAASQIAREWNLQGIYDIATAAGTAGNDDFGMDAPTEYEQVHWERHGLKTYLEKISGRIYNHRQGEGNIILGGPTAMLQLQKIGSTYGFVGVKGDVANPVYAGVNIFGTLNQQFVTYKVQDMDQPWALNKLFMLRKGGDFGDTPYVFAPYLLDMEPPRHGDSGDFSVEQGIMSRAARVVVSPKSIASLTFKDEEGVRV